jgi:hypothetical protein
MISRQRALIAVQCFIVKDRWDLDASLRDEIALSKDPPLSIAVLIPVISLSNLSGLTAIKVRHPAADRLR